jgi:thymidine phosphorylase
MSGQFFFIVGPSGAGKDSLISGVQPLLAPHPFVLARRVITRQAQTDAEDHDTCSVSAFLEREQNGDFLITWQAHGLHYGLPAALLEDVRRGVHVIANGSRNMIEALQRRVPALRVIEVTAPTAVLHERLLARQRESAQDIAQRLQRACLPLPPGVACQRVMNDTHLSIGVSRMKAALLQFLPETPELAQALYQKIGGQTLAPKIYAPLFKAIVAGQFPEPDVQAFLVACTQQLNDEELIAVTHARTLLYPRLSWPKPMVVDKHSMGGIPGSRVTMVVVPIVAAHGLLIPKTSSRAITSAAGTADAMEVLARVDLDFAQVQRCVLATHGCIAWNGRLNHSVLDDAINPLVRPLGLDTRSWSVASILSKKFTAGATHVVIDIPYASSGKVKTAQDAMALAALFERIGASIGLVVKAFATDGNAPIGRGIGPALEARDVLQVLDNDPDAPADLLDKALFFASQILALDSRVGDVQAGLALAKHLLHSGAAKRSLEAIIAAQGAMPTLDGPVHQLAVHAPASGKVQAIHGSAISRIAREAGAPAIQQAGVDLKKSVGDAVRQGEVLYLIQSTAQDRLQAAQQVAEQHCGYDIAA